jgi:hypothetical protein
MFGKQTPSNNAPPQQSAADAARIQGRGLAHLIVTGDAPLTYFVFLNDSVVPQEEVESLSVSIEAPGEGGPGGVSAVLSRYVPSVSGGRNLETIPLFPCTLEVIARGRRIVITATQPDSVEGMWIDLGLKPDGTGNEVSGAQRLQIVLAESILDARLTWTDGQTEDLLPVREAVS